MIFNYENVPCLILEKWEGCFYWSEIRNYSEKIKIKDIVLVVICKNQELTLSIIDEHTAEPIGQQEIAIVEKNYRILQERDNDGFYEKII